METLNLFVLTHFHFKITTVILQKNSTQRDELSIKYVLQDSSSDLRLGQNWMAEPGTGQVLRFHGFAQLQTVQLK